MFTYRLTSFLILLFTGLYGFSQPVSATYTSPGSHTFTVPSGYNNVTLSVRAWGGGGGGSNISYACGGGGGGGYSSKTYSGIGPGTYAIVVGSGGGPGSNGGTSSFNFTGLVTANGGNAGTSGGSGGIGGLGTTKSGGNGGSETHFNKAGGGGGGSGSGATNGQNANGHNGGNGGSAGGGDGGNTSNNGANGTTGGGGGGAGRYATSGSGGNGRVEVIVLGYSLPVELISFQAVSLDGETRLTWKTATEINSDFYAVEQSRNGSNWTELDMIPAAGQSVNIREYTYTHSGLNTGNQYYRLRIVDLDGSFEYSPTVVVKIDGKQDTQISAWKSNGQYMMSGIENLAGGQLDLYDVLGRQLASTSVHPGVTTAGLLYPEAVSGLHILVWKPTNGNPVAVKVY